MPYRWRNLSPSQDIGIRGPHRRGLIHTSANLRPDTAAGILNVELHGQANSVSDSIVAHICEELNTTETTYPGTNLRLKFTPIRSSAFPAGQDV